MDGMATESLDAGQEFNGRLKLGGQHQHLEVQERLAVPTEMTFACNREREVFYLTTHSTHFIYDYMTGIQWPPQTGPSAPALGSRGTAGCTH